MLLLTVTMARDCPIAFLALRRLEKLEASLFLPQGTFEKFRFLISGGSFLYLLFGVKATF